MARPVLVILQIISVFTIYAILAFVGSKVLPYILERVESDSSKETTLALYGGLLGGVAIAVVNPWVMPFLYDMHVATGMADQPNPDFEMAHGNLSEQNENIFGVEYQSERRAYIVSVSNPHQREITDLTLRLGFNNCHIHTKIEPTQYMAAPSAGVVDNVDFKSREEQGAFLRCLEEIHIDELSPGEQLTFYLVTDSNPDAAVHMGQTQNLQQGHVYLRYDYEWQYHGREYTENGDDILTNTTRSA